MTGTEHIRAALTRKYFKTTAGIQPTRKQPGDLDLTNPHVPAHRVGGSVK